MLEYIANSISDLTKEVKKVNNNLNLLNKNIEELKDIKKQEN